MPCGNAFLITCLIYSLFLNQSTATLSTYIDTFTCAPIPCIYIYIHVYLYVNTYIYTYIILITQQLYCSMLKKNEEMNKTINSYKIIIHLLTMIAHLTDTLYSFEYNINDYFSFKIVFLFCFFFNPVCVPSKINYPAHTLITCEDSMSTTHFIFS